MKKVPFHFLLSPLFLVLLATAAFGQYGNEWINSSQFYFKVSVANTGIYRLTYTDLEMAGFPVNSVDPRRFQLFHRGVEQAIIVAGQNDASFDAADYIEFYGQRNDGTLDADLYKPSTLQPHPYYNLYSDTTAYFLTYNPTLVLGKRMDSFDQVNVSGLPAATFQNHEVLNVYHAEYCGGVTVAGEIQSTAFDQGEGWTGATICTGNSGCTGQQDFQVINLVNGVQAAGLPALELLLVGRDELSHSAEVYVGPNAGALRLLGSYNFINYETVRVNATLSWSDISTAGQMIVRVKALGVNGNRDRLSASYIKVTHPQNFDFTGVTDKEITLPANAGGITFMRIANPPSGARIFDLSDTDNVLQIIPTADGSDITAIVPNTSSSKSLLISSTVQSARIQQVTMRQIDPSLPTFLVISHKSLMQPGLGYDNPVRSYAAYRASPEGGSYDTLVVTMDELYNAFNYGETSPRAIYKFMEYMVDNGDPKYLFIIGKGLDVAYDHRVVPAPNEVKDLVPSAGYPGSDMAFTAGLAGTTYDPAVATGRITASTPAEVSAYLNKVKETDTLGFDQLWRKNVLHLSGGIQPTELPLFKSYMDGFASIAEAPYYGAEVTTIAKHEAQPTELINISTEVNNGVNLVTFFGHSSPGTIDIDIGYATDPVLGYNNPGKYPAFLINGCNAGVFFSKSKAFGEDWILAADKGARNFIAHSSFGFVNTLKAYTELFYQIGFGDSLFLVAGIGDVQKEVAKRFLVANGASLNTITQVQQMMLLGDPSLKLFGASKPDYEINDGSLQLKSFDGLPVTALTDSFNVQVIVKNYGAVTPDTVRVQVKRTFNDNTIISYYDSFSSVGTIDTLQFKIKRELGISGFGNNQFEVTVDDQNKVAELDENNNTGTLSLFIPLNGTRNLFPRPFSIVSTDQPNLVFQNTNLLTSSRDYTIEIDTLDTFDSGYLQSFDVSGSVLLTRPITLLAQDSLVYYWRTRLKDPQAGENTEWATSSFAHIAGAQEGWAQIHFPQYSANDLSGLVADPMLRELNYLESSASVEITTFGSNNPTPPQNVSLKINNEEFNLATQGLPCRDNTLNLVAFNKQTMVPYAGIPFIFQDPRTCGREPQLINSFSLTEMDTGLGDDLIQYIDNIDISDSVVLFSIGDAGYASWTSNVISKLAELGIDATQITSLQPGEPVVIFGKKNAPAGTATVVTTSATPPDEQELTVSETLTGRYSSGSMTTPLIGPAKEWFNLISNVRQSQGTDVFSLDIIGVDLSGHETTLMTGTNGTVDLSTVSAQSYPWLKVRINTADDINLSPIQLHNWLVFYEPVAEGLLLHLDSNDPVTVQEGESFKTTYAFINISDKAFPDSLTVNTRIINKAVFPDMVKPLVIQGPAPGDSTIFDLEVSTLGRVGWNDVSVFVNQHQYPEQSYENNVIELMNFLNVEADHLKPVVTLTVDGRILENGDYVSPSPVIEGRVWDENQLIFKTDTLGVRLLIQYPCDTNCSFTQIYFNQPGVTWTPASDTSDFVIRYKPEGLPAGTYDLRFEAADASANSPGAVYEITFKVSEETSIDISNPFPNPSSEEVYFSMIIGGALLPDYLVIQFFDLQGRLIYSFGPDPSQFIIGSNLFSWDGRDAQGNLTLPGMYLYRVKLSAGGKTTTKTGKIILRR